MVIQRQERPVHWEYVLALEEDLLRLARFIDFSGNEETYSLEIARLLMTASAEADVVLKELCRLVLPDTDAQSIGGYYPIVSGNYPGLLKLPIGIHRYGLQFTPWTNWTAQSPPLWWTANNKIKHERANEYQRANLKHCLNAVTGLFGAVLYLYRDKAEGGGLHPPSSLMSVPEVWFGSNAMGPEGIRAYYKLPNGGPVDESEHA